MTIHSGDEESIIAYGIEQPAFRILVNTWGCLGGVGYTTGVRPSFTLGPGGVGGAVVSDNITVENVLNIRRVAYHLRDAPPVARAHGGKVDGAPSQAGDSPSAGGAEEARVIEDVVRRILTELRQS